VGGTALHRVIIVQVVEVRVGDKKKNERLWQRRGVGGGGGYTVAAVGWICNFLCQQWVHKVQEDRWRSSLSYNGVQEL